MDMSKLKVLVVGGGAIACEKLEKLVEFTKEITVISPEVSQCSYEIIKTHCLSLYQRAYKTGDIKEFDIVIVATDTIELHKSIYEESRGSRVLVNSVDDTAYCDFIFPSFIKRDDLIISFSTSGASPAFAKKIRKYFEDKIPQDIPDFLDKMKQLRRQLPKGKERMRYFEELVQQYFEKNFKN
jgi:precorrin-2 dehydrogenase/sirohydrochlorin ferrochelatase